MYRSDYKYTSDHQWLDPSSHPYRIGITSYAQERAGSIVFVVLPRPGSRCVAGEPYVTIETCDAIVELLAPLSGTVIAVNSGLNSEPANLNLNPHDHWLVMVSGPANGAEAPRWYELEEYRRLTSPSCGNTRWSSPTLLRA